MLISGSGNVASFAAIKCREFGATVLTFSDSSGTILEPNGFSDDQIAELIAIKDRRGRCSEYKSATSKYHAGKRPWKLVNCDVAIPSATQNELEEDDAKALIAGGCKYVFEGANMPSTPAAINIIKPSAVYFPAKVTLVNISLREREEYLSGCYFQSVKLHKLAGNKPWTNSRPLFSTKY